MLFKQIKMETNSNEVAESKDDNSQKDSKIDTKVSENEFKMPGLPGPVNKPQSQKDNLNKPKIGVEPEKDKNLEDEPSTVRENTQDKNKLSKLSPAEQLKQARIAIPYKEPSWGGIPESKYGFEVLKNGAIIDSFKLEKSYYVFGRLPSCDVTLEHPSLSRYHSIVQYCNTPSDEYEKGWYLYDLDSTHGTWINKHKVPPKIYHRLRVGHIVKFGGSTRLHILQGPETDREDESDLSVDEMKQQRDKQMREAELLRQMEIAEEERKIEKLRAEEEARGCSWGMDEPIEEETEESEENPFSLSIESEALYINDPKKTLKGFFEREGYDLPEYDVSEAGFGKYKCMVELPVDTPTGEPPIAEAVVSGKKKEAVIQCALEACRMLDRMGLLRASKHESHKRKKKNWEEEDFYDSDEDIYLDRTGAIEKKRQQRMEKAGKVESKAENYDSLLEKHKNITSEIQEIEAKLEKAKADEAAMENDDIDALDAYMSAIKSGIMDTKTRMKLKRQLIELKQEELKMAKLVNIAKPASLPELKKSAPQSKPNETKLVMPMIGKRKGLQTAKGGKKSVMAPVPLSAREKEDSFVEEEEEEDEEEENKSTSVIGSNSRVINDRLTANSQKSESLEKKLSSEINIINAVKETTSDASEKLRKNIQNIHVKGPSLPPADILESLQNKSDSEKNVVLMKDDQISPERKRVKTEENIVHKNKKKKKTETKNTIYDSTDPDYAVWLPPTNQSGDGKTHLNAKFGY